MITEDNYDLSHVAFITLGLIAEEPSYAKDIDDKIEERGMRNWTNIGTSSIYGVLKSLNKDGLLDSWVEEIDNRMVKIYKITPIGSKILKKKVYTVINEYYGRNDEDFYVAYSMFPLLSKEKQIEAFTNSLNKIQNHKIELEEMLKSNKEYPINVIGLFKHPIMILETDVKFLEWVIEEIKNK